MHVIFYTVICHFVLCTPYVSPLNFNPVLNLLQVTCLAVCLLSTGLTLVYIEPQARHVQEAKLKIEKEDGADQCIGKVDPDKLKVLEKNPQYVALSKRFGQLHALSSILNLIGLASLVPHIWYLAANLKSI